MLLGDAESAGGGGSPLYKPYRYVPLQRAGFYAVLVWNRVWLQGNYGCVRTYLSFQFQMSKKEREIGNSNGILRYLFCCCSNLSIDDIISLRPGLRMGIDFRGRV